MHEFRYVCKNRFMIFEKDFRFFITMSGMDYPGYVYSGLIALGGVMGYVKKRSVPSLAAGLLFGSLATYGAYSVS